MKLAKIFLLLLILLTSSYAKDSSGTEEGVLALHPLAMLLLKKTDTLPLTKKEKIFLKKKKKIILGINPTCLPYIYETKDKRNIGFLVDFLNKINKLSGIEFELKAGKYGNLIKNSKDKDIDGLVTSFKSNKNKKDFNSSISFLKQPLNIVVKHGNPLNIKEIKDLKNKTIVLLKGNQFLKRVVKKNFPDSKIIYRNFYEDVFEEVVFGKADATINEAPLKYLKNEKGLPYLNKAFTLNEQSEMFFLLKKDMPEAISILNKAIKAIPNTEIKNLYYKWFGSFSFHSNVLSQIDKEFIKKIKKVKVCTDSTWYAFNKENSNQESITTKFLDIVLERVGLEKDLIHTSTWEQSLYLLKKGDCDFISTIAKSDENSKSIKFTKPYTSYPLMLATHIDSSYLYNLDDLKDKKIAIIKDKALLKNYKYNKENLIYVSTPYEGLKLVQEKKVFAYVDLLPKFISIIDEFNYIKINRELDLSVNIHMGFRTTDNHLFHIIENSLSSISDVEKTKIFSKILKENLRKKGNKELIVQVFLVLLGIVFLVLIWNRQLNRSVKKEVQKNKEQESLLYFYSNQDSMKDLVGNISHQWRQPVNELSSLLFFLETKLHLNQDISIDEIKENTLKSRAIIDYLSNTVSTFSNYYINKNPESRSNILTLVEQSIFITDGSFKKLNTQIQLDIINSDLEVKGQFLQQVILAILNNARNIIVERKISNSLIKIKLYKKENNAILEIEDNFGGVEKIENVFELGTSNTKEGTGLGLFISKRIIEDKYGGKIDITNVKNGALFKIQIPLF